MQNTPPVNLLQYGRRKPHIATWAIVTVTIAASAIIAWRYYPAIADYVSRKYWEHQCMSYTAPADQVVFDNTGFPVSPAPQCVAKRLGLPPPPGSVIFVHERTSHDGLQRLVFVFYDPVWGRMEDSLDYFTTICLDPREKDPLQELVNIVGAIPTERFGTWPTDNTGLRMFAGQPDPSDSSHFTIRYSRNGQPGLIDGWLINGGTSVKYEISTASVAPQNLDLHQAKKP